MQSNQRGSQDETPFLPPVGTVKERAWIPASSRVVVTQFVFLLLLSLITLLNLVTYNRKASFIIGKLQQTTSPDL